MFKKLLSNLPFNPSLIDQVAFYANRLRREAYVRRVGFILVALTVFVQVFAVISPPEPSLARSNNDLIAGGVRSAEEATSNCRNNTAGYGDVLANFDISCDNVASSSQVELDSHSYSGELYTAGRLAYGKAGETPVEISGNTYWLRKLSNLDNGTSKHKALQGTSKAGKKFYIVMDCGGGVTFIGVPPTPTPKCEWNSGLSNADPKCFEPCPIASKQSLSKNDPKCFEACPVKGKSKLSSKDPDCFEPCPIKGKESVAKNSTNCFTPCAFSSTIATDNPACKPCENSQTRDDKTSCLRLSKTAKNDTQNKANVNGTTAKAGDVITYTLSATNNGKVDIKSFVTQENISDSLDYATTATLGGGKVDKNNIISWPAETIKPGQTLSKQFSVKVKDPLPSTPVSSSDPQHFDLNMTNVYGNAITVKLPANIVKSVEITSRTLPNTGPGISLIIAFGMFSIVGYFFARTRLMASELYIIKTDHNVGGGA